MPHEIFFIEPFFIQKRIFNSYFVINATWYNCMLDFNDTFSFIIIFRTPVKMTQGTG